MRILIAAIGSRGDIQPALALALGFRSAGHEVIVSAPPDFASWTMELGLPYAAAGDTVEHFMKKNAGEIGVNPLRVVRMLKKVVGEQLPEWHERTLEAAQGADAIVSCHQFASRSVAEKLGIPCICVIYQPTFLRSSHHPPMIVSWQGLPGWLNQICWSLSNAMVENIFKRPINHMRLKWGLPPVDSMKAYLCKGVPFLLAADAVLAAPPPDWNEFEVTITGPWFYEDANELPDDVEEFLQAGPPPVYVGFGSMPAKDPMNLTRVVVEGASARGRRVLMSKGWAGIGEGNLPPTVKVVHTPMPHHKLFPRLAVVVHHGGAGTTATALRAGVPQVIVPHLMDQYYYAKRMSGLGLAPEGIPAGQLSAARLAKAIDVSLALPAENREKAARRLRQSNGITRAIPLIEARVLQNRSNNSSFNSKLFG